MTSQPVLTWVARTGARDWHAPAAGPGPLTFHRSLPGYQPTPLVGMPELVAALGVARVLVKDESERLGLPAFKILGASWAVERALSPDNPSAGLRQPSASWSPRPTAAIAAEGATITQTRGTYQETIALAAEHASSGGRLLVQGSGELRARLGITKASTVVLLSTESSSANPARMPAAVMAR